MSKKQNSFIMQSRGPEVDELMKDPPAFMLLTQIARRARRTDRLNINNLKPGEAMIGDYNSIGLTEQTYRSAKKRLEKYGLATFKPTNRGTIATLCNSLIYDINIQSTNEQVNNQSATSQRSSQQSKNDQTTTKNNDKNDNKANNVKNVLGDGEGFSDRLNEANTKSELFDLWFLYRKSMGRHPNLYEKEVLFKDEWKNKTVDAIREAIKYTVQNGWFSLQYPDKSNNNNRSKDGNRRNRFPARIDAEAILADTEEMFANDD